MWNIAAGTGFPDSGAILKTAFNFIFHTITFTFHKHGLSALKQPVQDSGGQVTVVVKDLWPVIMGIALSASSDYFNYCFEKELVFRNSGCLFMNGTFSAI
jgi:hypothetical protein